jgi:hypothetical protein
VEHGHPQFRLNADEWRQIDYLLCITQPFYKWTTGLSKTKDITIHNIFRIYNLLFDHLERSIRQLRRKKVAWKQAMLRALIAGKEKLSVYYAKTEQVHGDLYAIGTILAPQHKLQFFTSQEWGGKDNEWQTRYRKSLEDLIEQYKQEASDIQIQSQPKSLQYDKGIIEEMFEEEEAKDIDQSFDELTRYLNTGSYPIPWFICSTKD